jgi:thiamine-monophosphate kinase
LNGRVSAEFELIAAIRERIAGAGASDSSPALVLGSGDDAAITVRGGATVTSVDALIEGVHFELPPFSLRAVGHKALAVALSDLAAMGARPGEAYVQLGVPAGRTEAELLELADGLAEVAATHAVAVAGGDLSRAPALIVAVTVVGEADDAEALVRRSGARAGDAVAVTGELGGAAAGLVLLQRPELAGELPTELADALRGRQLEPEPRLAAGQALAKAGASAMIDLSDGLGADAVHVAKASGAGISIELARVPVQPGVAEVAAVAGLDWLDLVAAGGEDYELLVAIAPERVAAARDRLRSIGVELTLMGAVSAGSGVELKDPDGASRAPSGFDQLRRRAPGDRA